MEPAVILPKNLYERLQLKSQQLDRTPDDVVADLVERYLIESDAGWQAEFEALLARVHARTAGFSHQEIEADITAASTEARKVRRDRRPA